MVQDLSQDLVEALWEVQVLFWGVAMVGVLAPAVVLVTVEQEVEQAPPEVSPEAMLEVQAE